MSFATVLAPVLWCTWSWTRTLGSAVPFAYVITKTSSRTATIAMVDIQAILGKTIAELSDQNYKRSFTFLRLWFEITHTYSTIPPDAILRALQTHYRRNGFPSNLIDPTLPLILRFAGDAESDHILAPHSTGLRSRLCAEALQSFFRADIGVVYNQENRNHFPFADANLIAHCINLGYVEESVIRDHILQALISHSTLHGHHLYALVVLFKTAGATLAAYADPTVVDRCFEIFKAPRNGQWTKEELVQVNTFSVKGATLRLRRNFRRSLGYGSVAGRVSLLRPYSEPGSLGRLARAWKALLRLQLSHPWDLPTEILNLRSHSPHNSSRLLAQSRTPFPGLLTLSPRQSASPACPTLQSQIPPMMRLLSTSRL